MPCLMSINAGGRHFADNPNLHSPRFLMHAITDFMANDHRVCDAMLVKVEHAVTKHNWELARSEFADYRDGMLHHFAAEESVLFPLFEQTTGMYRGPTQVMRGEHAQMRLLLTAAASALTAQDADDYAGNAETLLIMMQQHNVKEENVLYPMCDQHLAHQVEALLPALQAQIAGQLEVPT
ncbi:hemerythrin domain-containing protein [Accumulibacter sp.]